MGPACCDRAYPQVQQVCGALRVLVLVQMALQRLWQPTGRARRRTLCASGCDSRICQAKAQPQAQQFSLGMVPLVMACRPTSCHPMGTTTGGRALTARARLVQAAVPMRVAVAMTMAVPMPMRMPMRVGPAAL